MAIARTMEMTPTATRTSTKEKARCDRSKYRLIRALLRDRRVEDVDEGAQFKEHAGTQLVSASKLFRMNVQDKQRDGCNCGATVTKGYKSRRLGTNLRICVSRVL